MVLKYVMNSFDYSIKCSTQFLDQMKDIQIANNNLISLDVTALYTSVEANLPNPCASPLILIFQNITILKVGVLMIP